MSGFIHKAEDALHLHHHKDKTEHKHEDAHEHPPTIGHEGHEHTHRSHPPQNKHTHPHPNEEQIARDDFRSDREYDRALRSPHHGPGIGFEA